ncbi:hypothetical protein RDI58_022056 [Solanum bulbocastanum]|uniref:Secreted protein n=1 Tax=Solanum bulbocastanum TaxID=147425 RepID=A0AAN8T6L9_SOLBU
MSLNQMLPLLILMQQLLVLTPFVKRPLIFGEAKSDLCQLIPSSLRSKSVFKKAEVSLSSYSFSSCNFLSSSVSRNESYDFHLWLVRIGHLPISLMNKLFYFPVKSDSDYACCYF